MTPGKMTEQKAREIIKLHAHQERAIKEDLKFNPYHRARYEFVKSQGFLEGLEQEREKAKGLVEIIKRVRGILGPSSLVLEHHVFYLLDQALAWIEGQTAFIGKEARNLSSRSTPGMDNMRLGGKEKTP